MSRIHFAILLAGLATPAHAVIYKCVSPEGEITFADRRLSRSCHVFDSAGGPAGTASSPRRKASSNPSPASFPKVDRQTQQKRDDVRRTLLQEERKNEENALAAVRASLGDGKSRSPAERTKLTENQRLHEKNIEMLDKELARIK